MRTKPNVRTCKCGSEFVFQDYHHGNEFLCSRCRHSQPRVKDELPPNIFQQLDELNRDIAWQAYCDTQTKKVNAFLMAMGDGSISQGAFLLNKLFEQGLVAVTMSHEEILAVNEEWKRREKEKE